MMELAGKDFKTIINMLKDLKENLNIMLKEMETIEKNWMQLLELKNTVSIVKNAQYWVLWQIRHMEEKISELKDRKIEAAQTEHREKKRMGKKARLTIVYYVVF